MIWVRLLAVLVLLINLSATKPANVTQVKKVHLIFMNHLDVGYNGQPAPGFINYVLNRYFTEFFPRAAQLGEDLSEGGYTETFTYTTHPWLVSLYLDCPPHLQLAGFKLKCPTPKEVAVFWRAVRKGYISWHAGPMNMQMESMPEWLVERGLRLSTELDARFNVTRPTRVLSQRDVPGLTHAIIPTLVRNGISGISVGVNSMTAPPDVPRVFTWKYSNSSVIATWHPGGYPNNPGLDPSHPGGLSVQDCVVAPDHTDVMCFAFRTDNTGPPDSIQEILRYYEVLRKEFPFADIEASTLEKYFITLKGVDLPVISNEIGDTWILGISSDPRKSAEFRATARVLGQCLKNGSCSMRDKRIWNATRLLTKLGEHTWGLPTVNDTVHWSNQQFQPIQHRENFENCTKSWLEQRDFTYVAIDALKNHPVRRLIDAEMNRIEPKHPDLSGYTPVGAACDCRSDSNIRFSISNGAISYLSHNNHTWVKSPGTGMAEVLYSTYDAEDFKEFGSQYDYIPGDTAGFIKANVTENAAPESVRWPFIQTAAFTKRGSVGDDNCCDIWVHLETVDHAPRTKYGAPQDVWIHYEARSNISAVPGVDVELQWFDKPATRLPEAIFLKFTPVTVGHQWFYSKLGRKIDPLNVVRNGSQYQHAVDDGGVYLLDQSGCGLQIMSPDVPVACPITDKDVYPTIFPAPLQPITDPLSGVAFNLYNNIWDTNYIFWYPYIPQDQHFKARFAINFGSF